MIGIGEIIKEEWRQFQLVQNEGGRASCQDNWTEFELMRKSQFMTWTEEMLESYYMDLERAAQEGRNLLFEKYAFMMKDTAPEKFDQLRSALPELSEKKQRQIDEIVDAQVRWAEEFQKSYPAYAGNGRPIHASEAIPGDTSIETYTRGELSTYGERTVELYLEYVRECVQDGRNLASEVRGNVAKLYGYESLEAAEEYIKKHRS